MGKVVEAIVSVAIMIDGLVILVATVSKDSGAGLVIGAASGLALVGASAIWLLLLISDYQRGWHLVDYSTPPQDSPWEDRPGETD